MDGFLDLDTSAGEPGPPALEPMSPERLGESLAHLLWESFSDELTDPEVHDLLGSLDLYLDEGVPDQRVVEELLILLLWAHTRTVQLAFHQRASEGWIRETLDALHGAVFEDLVKQGTPEAQLPLFEQRISARYSEYYLAAEESDERVGEVAARHLAEDGAAPEAAVRLLTARTISVSGPLRDFLLDVEPSEANEAE